ncbi:hypothetical protein [Pantoea sp. Lij88]|uniref:hypothetical protein n=1 Tax=Pantoea sp. Lij88 TaxID=3028622 RepID=UPI0024BBC009|nr:hypothetical protein [Pantoea sp. Lij88]WHQ75030.1 hypothetical protein PU624_19915 [Pantoea sp. Lij88]
MMTSIMMSNHKAYKALQQAGIDDQQAEAMVEIFSDMQQRQPGAQVGKQLGQLRTKVDQIDDRLGHLITKVNQIDERLGHVERKIDKLAIRFTHQENKVDKMEVMLSEMNYRLTGAVDSLRGDVLTLTTDMRWIKRLSILMTTALLAAVMKDILL